MVRNHRRKTNNILLVAAIVTALVALWQTPVLAQPAKAIVVNDNSAKNGAAIKDACTSPTSPCTLRSAIEIANGKGNVTVRFDLPAGQRVITDHDLPVVTAPNVVIDATLQPGYQGAPLISVLNESRSGVLLSTKADHTTVKGLQLRGTGSSAGIWVQKGATNTVVSSNHLGGRVGDGMTSGVVDEGTKTLVENNLFTRNNTGLLASGAVNGPLVQANVFGTNRNGDPNYGNLTGIAIEKSTLGAAVGGNSDAKGNIMSGNTATGVRVSNSTASIQGNWFGIGPDGVTKIINQNGVLVENGAKVTIGGVQPNTGNTFVASAAFHVNVGSNAKAEVFGNYFGTNRNGTLRGSAPTAVQVSSKASGTMIGGVESGQANVIANATKDIDVTVGAKAEVGNNKNFETTAAPKAGSEKVKPVSGGDGQVVDSKGNVNFAPVSGTGTVATAPTPSGEGSYSVTADGKVFVAGDAVHRGSMSGKALNAPVTGVSVTSSGNGYFLTAADGGVFAFGDAIFVGSTANERLAKPVRHIVANCSGKPGYWLVGDDGGVFAFGGAQFHGSLSGRTLNSAVRTLVPDCEGGYWIVTNDGGVFAFGSAEFHGSLAGNPPRGGVAGLVPFENRHGYWIVERAGNTAHAFGER